MQILVIEDDIATRTQFEKVITQLGHHALLAGDGRGALAILDDHQIDLVIAKRIMADINGMELCDKIRTMNPGEVTHFALTVEQDSRFDLSQAMESGVDDVITVPFNAQELQIKLALADRMVRLERELNQKHATIQRNYQQTIHAMAQLIETYNEQVGHHCRRVGTLALWLSKRHPRVSPDDHPLIEAAGLIHDIGLIGLPEAILTKGRTALTGEEAVLFRSHCERGEAIIGQLDMLKPLSRLVRMHHEQFNGRGFPDGLSGEQIPVAAQIIAAASLYDDLAYREKIELEKIPEVLQQYRGYQLDPAMVALLLEINLIRLQEEAGRDHRPVLISDAAEGMVLGADVVMKSGAFVMAAGTRLDANILQKLKRYHESGNIMDKVFIRK